MMTIAIIDDEPLARAGWQHALAKHPDVVVVGEASNVNEGLTLLAATRPQAVLLDIRMPGANGFDLLSRLDSSPLVIFATAYSEHAVRAFDVQAVDYLLKPVEPSRLAQSLERLRACLRGSADAPRLARGDRICLRSPEKTTVVHIDEIVAISADGDFSRFTLAQGESVFICRSLGSFLAELPSPPMLRLDRSLAINLDRFRTLEKTRTQNYNLRLHGHQTSLVLGRAATTRLRSALGGRCSTPARFATP